MSSIAIIPARGGSKRIPRKNIKPFMGNPIIAYSIKAALECNLFDEVMVSTDDDEIAQIAVNYGAKVPFFRSKETANDFATTADVLIEVLNTYKKEGKEFEYISCIYPTSPFVTPQKLKEAFDTLIQGNFYSVFPVLQYGYPIFRSLKMEQNKISMNWPEYVNYRSQDLPLAFHDSGQFYIAVTQKFLDEKTMFTSNSGAIIVPETEAQDIDNEIDWKLAEIKFKMIQNNKK